MRESRSAMTHLNGNKLVAVDTETTGLYPGYHEVCQVAFLPLNDDFTRDTSVEPFVCLIKPEHPNRWQAGAAKVNGLKEKSAKHGVLPELAYDMFVNWFYDKLQLPETGDKPFTKQMQILAKNWPFDQGFLLDWMGMDDNRERNMYKFIHRYTRDLQSASLYIQDLAFRHGTDPLPFTRFSLNALCNRLSVTNPQAHDALGDCIATAECYRRLLQLQLPVGVDLNIKSPDWQELRPPPTDLELMAPDGEDE